MSTAYKITPLFCPQCSYRMDTAESIHGGDGAPDPGDCSVCSNCGRILVFDDRLVLRKATAAEIKELMDDPLAWGVINLAVQEIKRRGPLPVRTQA